MLLRTECTRTYATHKGRQRKIRRQRFLFLFLLFVRSFARSLVGFGLFTIWLKINAKTNIDNNKIEPRSLDAFLPTALFGSDQNDIVVQAPPSDGEFACELVKCVRIKVSELCNRRDTDPNTFNSRQIERAFSVRILNSEFASRDATWPVPPAHSRNATGVNLLL